VGHTLDVMDNMEEFMASVQSAINTLQKLAASAQKYAKIVLNFYQARGCCNCAACACAETDALRPRCRSRSCQPS
jgi:uncharacterized protein (DUF779 family)